MLACLVAMLMSLRMMAQDTTGDATGGGGNMSGGAAQGDTGANSGNTGNTGNGSTGGNGAATGGATPASTPAGSNMGTGTGDQNGTGTTGGGLFGPDNGTGTGTGATGGGSVTVPNGSTGTLPPAGYIVPIPGTTPAPTTTGTSTVGTAGTVGTPEAAAMQSAPVSFSLPGGYAGAPQQSFTLGEGRLARPPVTLTLTVSQGYDDNIFSATAHPVATPTPIPVPTPLPTRVIVGFRITPLSPPRPIFETIQGKASPTPAPVGSLGVVGSPVTTAAVAIGIQKGSPRTIFTLDASVGEQDYWNQPGQQTDYTGALSLNYLHHLTPRATFDVVMNATYQKTPNFALINAPTNNGNGGEYLNGFAKTDLTYMWTKRISTVTYYSLDTNLLDSNPNSNLYESTYGTSVKYAFSVRNTASVELRQTVDEYPSNGGANSTNTFYLVGLDSVISTRLHNTVSAGIEDSVYPQGGSQTIPYFETATTLGLPRSAALTWTNRYGAEASQSADQQITSYRTALTYSQPLSTKLVVALSIAFNDLTAKDSATAAGSFDQKQFQASLNAVYTISPRFSLNASYTYLDLSTNQVNTSYKRNQTFIGGSYTFK
jgi:hypothetical protein